MKIIPDVPKEKSPAESVDGFSLLKFVTDDQAKKSRLLRNDILAAARDRIGFRQKRTKVVYRAISPGCEICGNGSWSCLFINGKCNCRCFYCPTDQTLLGVPTTNTLTFPRSRDYVDYIDKLAFKGVSVSGGEPLITADQTVNFISAVKKKFGDNIYLWLYTNGTLATPDILARLKDAGLNEIRFDIGAAGYALDKAAMAVGLFDHVTVEIPAVPEDYELMTAKLKEMSDRGLSFLNLHQLRLTSHNLPNMISRGYTCLHGEHITVLESELTALRLIRFAVENDISLPINYCSFVYKNRFQKAASRKRCGQLIRKTYEDITENGYIRSLYVKGPADAIGSLAGDIKRCGCSPEAWFITKERDRLFFNAGLWPYVSRTTCGLFVSYYNSRLAPSISYINPFKEVVLNRKRSIYIERTRAAEDMEIPPPERDVFERIVIKYEDDDSPSAMSGIMKHIQTFETIAPELQDYA